MPLGAPGGLAGQAPTPRRSLPKQQGHCPPPPWCPLVCKPTNPRAKQGWGLPPDPPVVAGWCTQRSLSPQEHPMSFEALGILASTQGSQGTQELGEGWLMGRSRRVPRLIVGSNRSSHSSEQLGSSLSKFHICMYNNFVRHRQSFRNFPYKISVTDRFW